MVDMEDMVWMASSETKYVVKFDAVWSVNEGTNEYCLMEMPDAEPVAMCSTV